jgi:hypothetical protein
MQFTNDMDFIQEFWGLNEKFYIYTFLGIQFAVKAIFYWLIFLILKRFLFLRIKRKLLNEINQKKSVSELKTLSELKQSLIQLFGLPIELGILDHEDIHEKFEMTEDIFDDIMKTSIQWICVFIHLAFVSLLIWHLNAFYIIPLLALVFFVFVVFLNIFTILFGNVQLIEKVRVEVVNKLELTKAKNNKLDNGH